AERFADDVARCPLRIARAASLRRDCPGNAQRATRNPFRMSTLTKFSATPYTGPAPTNRDPYVPQNAEAMDARGAEIAVKVAHSAMAQELGQDLPTFIVEKDRIVDVLRALHDHPDFRFTLPLDLFGADYPNRAKRFDVLYQLYSLK